MQLSFINKKILITGHTGFKGSWLSLILSHLGAKNIYGLSLAPESLSLANIIDTQHFIGTKHVDITHYEELACAIEGWEPEVIFHLAAQPLVSESFKNPLQTYQTNVLGTVHVLEAVRSSKSVKVIVNITTDKCYENMDWPWRYRENDRLGGSDPYSSSKAASELITASYYNSFLKNQGIKVATARAGNVIGGGDFAVNRLIPDIIRAINTQKPLYVRYPTATRPWQHVLDCSWGYILLANYLYNKQESIFECFNFSPIEGESPTVINFTNIIKNKLPRTLKIKQEELNSFPEHNILQLDSSKAKKILNWGPQLTLEQMIDITSQWYTLYLNDNNDINSLREITHRQIKDYLSDKEI